jgi:hypothetical protein
MDCKLSHLTTAVLSVALAFIAAAPSVRSQAAPARRQVATQERMTNAEVLRLLKERRSEAEIIRNIKSAMQSGTAAFDLSPNALIALHQAGASNNVLNAMMGDGSVRPAGSDTSSGAYTGTTKPGANGANADALNPQPLPPNQRSLRLGAAKLESPVKNSKTAQLPGTAAWDEIIAVLEKEKSGAQLEASQMTNATLLRPSPQPKTTPLNTTSASGGKTASPTGAAASAATANTALLSNQAPEKHQPPQPAGAGTVSPLAVMPAGVRTGPAITCSHDSTMRILTVSGVDGPATFSPNPRYTLYTITGCSLGDAGPNAKVYLYQNAFRLDFQIQEWNDNGVKFVLDPNVTGVLDQVNATLVVQRADGKQTAKSGCKFYAARETRMLPHVPRANFSLNKFTPTDTSALQATYTSPSSADVAPNIGGYTAEVFWADPKAGYNQDHPNFSVWMPSGEDVYLLKNLQPGFVVDNAALAHKDLACPSGTLHTQGTFSTSFVGDELHVLWQGQTCTYAGCGGFGQGDCFGSNPGSNYAINVTITGPRGVDPWTGKPTATR